MYVDVDIFITKGATMPCTYCTEMSLGKTEQSRDGHPNIFTKPETNRKLASKHGNFSKVKT